jgi:hypothetical protein
MAPYAPIQLAGSVLGDHRHVCAFFDGPEDECRVMMPFFRDGMARGERAVSIVPTSWSDYRGRLRSAGVDPDAPRGQFELRSSEEYYESEGPLDPDAMLRRMRQTFEESRALGFPLTRLAGHAGRSLVSATTIDAYLEYEARLNDVVTGVPDVVVCTYDARQVSAGVALEVLRTHPMAIVRGVLQENPFFVPPTRLLGLLRRRARSRERGDETRA